MISLEFSNHIKTFDFKSNRSQVQREAIEAVIAGQSLSSLFERHGLNFEERKQLVKTKLGYPHRGEECSRAAPRFAHLMSFHLAKFILYYIGA